MIRVGAICFVLAACAPSAEEFTQNGPAVPQRDRDYADCRIKARNAMAPYGGSVAGITLMNQTLEDCMTAKGYARQ